MLEKDVHDLIINDETIRRGVLSSLNIEDRNVEFIHEDTYINGIIADFTLLKNNEIKSIIEVKGANINVTDYVRGIGQVFQYEYFMENNLTAKSFTYGKNFSTVLLFPSDVVLNNSFNIGKFKYPESLTILELNIKNSVVRKISKRELQVLENIEVDSVKTISQYYFRDNRIYEYYILLNFLLIKQQYGETKIDRKELENEYLRQLETVNNRNWRNAFISLSSLGLIDSNNLPTPVGKKLAVLDYDEFALSMYNSYIAPYADEIYKCFKNNTTDLNNKELCNEIRERFNNKDVLFLTQSNSRYLSSWINILKDDYGIISSNGKSKEKFLIYNPNDLNDNAFKRKINELSVANDYITRYRKLLKEWR